MYLFSHKCAKYQLSKFLVFLMLKWNVWHCVITRFCQSLKLAQSTLNWPSTVMSSATLTHSLVTHQYDLDSYIPRWGEIILVPLAADLYGPGSDLSTTDHCNYHKAVVLGIFISDFLEFTIFPIPDYSITDPKSHLSSTRWLLSQPDDFKKMHIPMPYETPFPTAAVFGDSDVTHSSALPQPSFPTPVAFGDPLEFGGWKDNRPSWLLAVPQLVRSKYSAEVCILFCLVFTLTDMSTAVQKLQPPCYDECR
jgi:hypothetical protein